MSKTKLGQKVMSSALAFVLAFGVCVPAVSFSAIAASPDVAMAAEEGNGELTKDRVLAAARSAVGKTYSTDIEFLVDVLTTAGVNVSPAATSIGEVMAQSELFVETTTPQPGDIVIDYCPEHGYAGTGTNDGDYANYGKWESIFEGFFVEVAYPNSINPLKVIAFPSPSKAIVERIEGPLKCTNGSKPTHIYKYYTYASNVERTLEITKQTRPYDGLTLTETTLSYFASDYTGPEKLNCGDKSASLSYMAGEGNATLDISDLPVGVYPVSTTRDNETMAEGTLTVKDMGVALPTSLKLESPEDIQKGTSYTAIKVFDADVTGNYGDEEAPKASNIKHMYDSGYLQYAFSEAGGFGLSLPADGSFTDADFENPQKFAEFISQNINHQPNIGLSSSDFGMKLAKALLNGKSAGAYLSADAAVDITADAADFTELDGPGYYLIVKKGDLTGENTAASSPIFVALGEGAQIIDLKTAIPTVTKQVQEDSTGEWGIEANHTLNQEVNYKLVGTVADNVDAYATYKYNFVDSWDAAKMTLKDGSVAVKIGDTDLTTAATIKTDEAGKLSISFDNLKAVYPALSATDSIVVEYTAYQSGTAASPDGIENEAFLEYSNNPVFDSVGTTPKSTTKDYSYQVRIHKTDKGTGDDLAGVEFSVKNKAGKFLAVVDGKFCESDTAYSFTTDENGMIVLDGVDADDYTIEETKALPGYDDLGTDITVSFDDTDIAHATAAVTSASDLVAGENAEGAVSQIAVMNVKQIGLPSTGEMGLGLIVLVAAAAIAFGIASRRRNNKANMVMVVR